MTDSELSYPSQIEPEAYMEESYALLQEGLKEFLAQPDIQLSPKETDYLEAILEKINFSMLVVKNEEDRGRLMALKDEVWKAIAEQFRKDYADLGDMDTIDESNISETRFVYYFFYYNRRANIQEMLVSSILSNRKELAQQYKKETKKDFMLSRLKDELPGMKNPLYYSIIAYCQEIVENFLTAELDFIEMVQNVQLNFDQVNFLNRIFEDGDQQALYSKFVAGFVEHDDFAHFVMEVRDDIINKITEMN